MKINTKVFGEVEIADDKIIHFPSGIVGFPEPFSRKSGRNFTKISAVAWAQAAFTGYSPFRSPALQCR